MRGKRCKLHPLSWQLHSRPNEMDILYILSCFQHDVKEVNACGVVKRRSDLCVVVELCSVKPS